MKKICLYAAGLTTIVLSLTACSNATVSAYPTNKGNYNLVALSSSESDALKAATKKAQKICTDQHKQLQVISSSTQYQGAYDKKTRKTINIASDVAEVATVGMVPGGLGSSSNDYKTTMTFKCS